MRSARHHIAPCTRRNSAPWLPGIAALALLFALPLLWACSSGNSVGSTMTSVTTGSPGSPASKEVGTVVTTSDGAGTYVDITPDELAAMLKNKDFLFINTHTPYEGEIEQTDLFLPYDKAAQQLGQLPADKNAKIVVYCRSDRMSRISIEEWVKARYTDLYNLDGGFVAWEAAGYELLQK
jgi:rhodanese-related sulfurtransferase